MSTGRTNPFLTRAICFLLAMYLFNMSIDSRDQHPDSIAEDLTFNDIESISELLVEVVFGYGNVIEEHDERDSDDGGTLDFYKFYFSNTAISIETPPTRLIAAKFPIAADEPLLTRPGNVLSPPPKRQRTS